MIKAAALAVALCFVAGVHGLGEEFDEDGIYTAQWWYDYAQKHLDHQIAKQMNKNVAKNAIFFLGDGMGVTATTAGRIYTNQKDGLWEHTPLAWEEWPFSGLAKTHCANKHTTDSAASATAYLTGVKGPIATTGVGPETPRMDCPASVAIPQSESIAKWAQDAGMWTGVISTARITHASPAALYAHAANRNWEGEVPAEYDPNGECKDIAQQLVEALPGSELRLILGGGKKFLQFRADGRNLTDEWLQLDGNRRYISTVDEVDNFDIDSADYLMGLFQNSHMMYQLDEDTDMNKDQPSLLDLVDLAIRFLSKGPNGYFLFVEGGRIDQGFHQSMARQGMEETRMLSHAAAHADEITSADDTLIITTADHTHAWSTVAYPDRHHDIFDPFDASALDGKPLMFMEFSTGPGAREHDGGAPRRDLNDVDTQDKDFKQPAFMGRNIGTHGTEDVGIWARGPMSHLYEGSLENNYIPHAMARALCIGPSAHWCPGNGRKIFQNNGKKNPGGPAKKNLGKGKGKGKAKGKGKGKGKRG